MDIFSVASRHMAWLSARQAVIAGNIANVNTPGFKAREISALTPMAAAANLVVTHAGHITAAGDDPSGFAVVLQQAGRDVPHGENTVRLEEELMKASEGGRQAGFDTSVMKTFHRLVLASLK
jgi:flagellar basal-body rod protein FlgB